jgi:hypothetical protein
MATAKHITQNAVAGSVPYDNSTSGIPADDVQGAIDAIAAGAGSGASPGFTYGRSGVSNTGTYLLNETVPSNISGRTMPVSGTIAEVFVAQELAGTFSFKIQKRSGASFVDLATFTVTAVRTATFATSIAITKGDEIAVVISSDSTKNVVIGFVAKGTMS